MSEQDTPPVHFQFSVGFCILPEGRMATLTLYGDHEVTSAVNAQACKEIAEMLLHARRILLQDKALEKLNKAAEDNGEES